ncbi:MAG: hypothetical protein F4Y58_04565 [Gammaproteobacteria bacterium]|nr:hypothetical protein [Gammaproteobacteria bacterium]
MATVKRTFLELYALAVCFINILIGSIAVGIIIYGAVSVISPELTLSSWEYSKYQSNDEFIASRPDTENFSDKFKNMSVQEISRERDVAYRLALKAEQRDGMQSIIRFFIVLLIQIILFIVHWRLAQRQRSSD